MKNAGSLALLVVFLSSLLLMCLNFASGPQLGDGGILAMDELRFIPVFANEMFVLWEKKKAGVQVRKSFSDDGRVGVPENE